MSVKITVIINIILIIILAFSLWNLWLVWQEFAVYSPVIESEVDLAGLEQKLEEINLDNVNSDKTGLISGTAPDRGQRYGTLSRYDFFYLKEEEQPLIQPVLVPLAQEEVIPLPEVEQAEAEVEVKPPLENPFILLAVLNHRDYSKAILVNKYTDESYIIRAGDEIEGFLVKKISGSRVVLGKMEQEFNLSFEAVTKRRGF